MASSEDNLDSRMDYQEINFEENISVSNTVSSNDDYEKSFQFVSSAACASALEPNIDLKSCEFDVLLSYLSNKMIFKNIRAIYNFLKGNNDEIEFRGANMYMEEILVRIVRNVEVLRSERFAQACTLYCKLIIDLFKNALSNRIYMVACIYKNERDYLRDRVINYKILIYKKLYYTSHYETQMQIFDGPTSIMSMSSTPPMSRSTSVDSLDSQRSNFDIKPSSNPFILHCLHLIFNFVKDQTQLSLNFSGLSKSETIYFHSVFTSAIDEKFDNGTLCKNVYRAIWEAVKIFSLKFDFRIRNLRCSLNTKSLLLEKRIKLSVCQDERASGTSHSRTSKRKLKKSEKNRSFVNQFPLDFINCCLKKMLKFLSDESEASLIIPVCNPEEKKFVKNIINYIRSPAVRSNFNDEPRTIMEELNKLLDNRSNYRLKTSGKNKFGQNDVKFMKIPKFEDRFSQQNIRYCDMGSPNMLPPEDSPPQQSSTSCDVKSINIPPSEDLPPQQSTSCDVEAKIIPLPEDSTPQQSNSCDVESLNIPPTEDSTLQQNTSCDTESPNMLPPEDSPPQQSSTSCDVKSINIPPSEDLPPQQSTSCDVEAKIIPLPEDSTPQQSSSCDVEAKIIPLPEDSTPQQSSSCDVESLDMPPPNQSPPKQRCRLWYPRGETVARNLGVIRKVYFQTEAGFQQSAHGHSHLGWDSLYAPPRLDTSFQPAGITDQIFNSEADPVLTEMMIKYGNTCASNDKKQWVDSIGHQPKPKPKPAVPKSKDCRNDQLLEALSVPVQSDKALKMMFSMGWTGGALGARGNGITEPIMPYLNSGTGAGFGHKIHLKNNNKLRKGNTPVATPSVSSRIMAAMSSNNRHGYIFREIFLSHLLDLLASTDNSTTLNLCPNITKKEIAFVNHTIRNLAARARVKLDDDGQNIVNDIELHYKKDPEMLVTACVHDDKKLVLTKRHGLGKMCHSEEARNQRLSKTEDITKNMTEFMIHYGPMVYTQQSYDEMKFKVLFSLEVLKLVKDKTLDNLVVDMVMTLREKNLLYDGLNSINKKKKFREKTPDTVLFLMIRKFMDCYTVNVKFTKKYTQFTLYKEYLVPSMAIQ